MNSFGFDSLTQIMFAGIPDDGLGEIYMLPFGRWLLLVALFVLLVCFLDERQHMNDYMVWIRQKSFRQMWRKGIGAIYLKVSTIVLVLVVGVSLFDYMKGCWKNEYIIISFFYLIHILFMTAIVVVINLIGKSKYIILVVVAEALSYILSVQIHFSLAIGMYCYWSTGSALIINIILKLIVICAVWMNGDWVFRKE